MRVRESKQATENTLLNQNFEAKEILSLLQMITWDPLLPFRTSKLKSSSEIQKTSKTFLREQIAKGEACVVEGLASV